MAKNMWKLALATLVLAAAWNGLGQAETAATIVGSYTAGYPTANDVGYCRGWRFFVNEPMTITDLGVLDSGDPGLSGSHRVGLWQIDEVNGGAILLASVDITGTVGTLTDGHRFVEIEPITLPADSIQRYLIGVWTESNGLPIDGIIIRPTSAMSITGAITIEAQLGRLTGSFNFPWSPVSEYDHFGVNFQYRAPGPAVDAGPDMEIHSADQISEEPTDRTILGTATDATEYRWLEAATVLLDYTAVGTEAQAYLDMNDLEPPFFPTNQASAQYVLTLEATDGTTTASDEMTLTVLNTASDEAALASQVVQLDLDPIIVTASVSDFDGDTLSYEWFIGTDSLGSGTVDALQGGEPVTLPDLLILPEDADYEKFQVGTNTVDLHVTDPTGTVVTSIAVEVVDTTAPTLAPIAWPRILWPPDGQLKEVTIWANAFDNGGGDITLDVAVTGFGVDADDYEIVSIDNETGVIQLLLRASVPHHGPAKVYKIIITATDESGNQSVAQVNVVSPHRGWKWRWGSPCR